MADQSKTPLKVVQSSSNFHRIRSLPVNEIALASNLKGDIKDFSSGGGAGLLPLKGGYVKYTIIW